MTNRTASCSCGQLSVTVDAEPVRVSVCHCLACQKRTGSAFAAQARFAASSVQVRGESTQYVRVADSGNRVTFRFCPQCGATVHYTIEGFPNLIAVPLGAFADPSFPTPRFSVYENRKHSWVALPDELEGD